MKNCKFTPCNCQQRQKVINRVSDEICNHEPKPESNHEIYIKKSFDIIMVFPA